MAKKLIFNKRGQMTIWIIVAIAIIVFIILLFIFQRKVNGPVIEKVEEDPRGFISNCVKKYIQESIDIMLPQGGFVKPEHTRMYKGVNVSYLCYNSGNYNPCINEHPILLNEIKEEIKNYISPKVDECFKDYKRENEKRNARVDLGEMNLNVDLGEDRVFVDIDKKVVISKQDISSSFDRFKIEIISPIYNLARVAIEIASQEAKYCYFEYGGYMILYPEFKISRDVLSDSTEIYTLQDKKSEKEMNIAIRSCAIPPGL